MKRPAARPTSGETGHVLRRPAAPASILPSVAVAQHRNEDGLSVDTWAQDLALGPEGGDTSNARSVYLVTFARLLPAKTSTAELRDPATLPREALASYRDMDERERSCPHARSLQES